MVINYESFTTSTNNLSWSPSRFHISTLVQRYLQNNFFNKIPDIGEDPAKRPPPPTSPPQTTTPEPTVDPNNPYGFGLPEGKYTWDEGKAKCESMGSHLAYIKTPAEQQAAMKFLDSVWDPSQCGGNLYGLSLELYQNMYFYVLC